MGRCKKGLAYLWNWSSLSCYKFPYICSWQSSKMQFYALVVETNFTSHLSSSWHVLGAPVQVHKDTIVSHEQKWNVPSCTFLQKVGDGLLILLSEFTGIFSLLSLHCQRFVLSMYVLRTKDTCISWKFTKDLSGGVCLCICVSVCLSTTMQKVVTCLKAWKALPCEFPKVRWTNKGTKEKYQAHCNCYIEYSNGKSQLG